MSFLPHKKSTWTDFGGIYTHIPPSLCPWW